MGLYDDVIVDEKILKEFGIACPSCGEIDHMTRYQTKDFYCELETYYLTRKTAGDIKLYKLDPPSDKRFFREYTDEEIEKWNTNASTSPRALFWPRKRKKGDGQWLDEAYLPENRTQRDMGVEGWPHQICRFYAICTACDAIVNEARFSVNNAWVEMEVKFTDGVVQSICQVPGKF
jgi:hypothetical protein